MRWFQNLSIGAKLMCSFALAAALAGGIGWIGLSSTEEVHRLSVQMYADRLMPIRDLGYANASFLIVRTNVWTMLATKDAAGRQKLAEDIVDQSRKFDEYFGAYLKTNLTKEEQDLIAKFRPTYEEYNRHRAEIVQFALSGKDAAAVAVAQGAAKNPQLESRRLLRELIDVNAKFAEQDQKDSLAASNSSRYKILVLIALGVLMCIVLGLVISKIIGNPVRKLSAAADTLALGDVNVDLPDEGKDELGALAHSFRIMAENIKNRSAEAQKLASGDLSMSIETKSDRDLLGKSLIQAVETLRKLVEEAESLTKAAVAGELATRGHATAFEGGYRKIVEGVNQTLDAVVAPITESAAVIERVAAQDLTVQVVGDYKGDHARIKENINRMIVGLRQNILQIAQNAQSLASSAEELSAVSHQMSSSATETSTQAGVVSAASEQVSKNVSVVATGSEQMLASIREIARSSNEAAKVARNAVGIADSTNQTVSKLGDSSVEIGNVIKVITSIAQQTNLLALNATIEAARAGEAGKGFAVVANEVKELANQTARATEEIGQRIEAIQTDTKEAVGAIGGISGIINQINDISNSIAASVEEQTATTNEMGRNVTEAAKGTGEIARNINGVAAAAQQTNEGANNTESAARSLTEMAAGLQLLVSKFRT